MLSTKISASKSVQGVATEGGLYMWGENSSGQLGDGTTTAKSSPVLIGYNYPKLSGGDGFTIAINTDGELWSWGYNPFGQLGDGTTVNKSSPIQIGSLTTWNSINPLNVHPAASLEN